MTLSKYLVLVVWLTQIVIHAKILHLQEISHKNASIHDPYSILRKQLDQIKNNITNNKLSLVSLINSETIRNSKAAIETLKTISLPYDWKNTRCLNLNHSTVKAYSQQLLKVNSKIDELNQNTNINNMKAQVNVLLNELNQAYQADVKVELKHIAEITSNLYQTNLQAGNWVYGQDFTPELLRIVYFNNTVNSDISNCPLSNPYFNGSACIQCQDQKNYFDLSLRICVKITNYDPISKTASVINQTEPIRSYIEQNSLIYSIWNNSTQITNITNTNSSLVSLNNIIEQVVEPLVSAPVVSTGVISSFQNSNGASNTVIEQIVQPIVVEPLTKTRRYVTQSIININNSETNSFTGENLNKSQNQNTQVTNTVVQSNASVIQFNTSVDQSHTPQNQNSHITNAVVQSNTSQNQNSQVTSTVVQSNASQNKNSQITNPVIQSNTSVVQFNTSVDQSQTSETQNLQVANTVVQSNKSSQVRTVDPIIVPPKFINWNKPSNQNLQSINAFTNQNSKVNIVDPIIVPPKFKKDRIVQPLRRPPRYVLN